MKRALFPGTFDPPTLGHLDIIQRAASICNKLYVGVAENSNKPSQTLFTTLERMAMLQEMTRAMPYVEVVSFSTLVVEFAKQHQIDFLLRGLRAFSDFEYEFRMALTNRHLSGIETVFLMADERVAHISSTLIRELARYHAPLSTFVPKEIALRVAERIAQS